MRCEIKRMIKELRSFQGFPSELDPIYKELLVAFKAYRMANPEAPNIEIVRYVYHLMILKDS